MNRLALIADVHGNIWALEAVLSDIRRRRIDHIFDLGDVAQGSLHPAETIARLRDENIESVRGNTDRMLLDERPAPGSEADYALARSTMSAVDFEWLARQPLSRQVGDLLLCHGTPCSDITGLLETIDPERGVRLATDSEVVERLGDAPTVMVIASGHTHIPEWCAGRVCVNPGSVGLPAYEEEQPFPHSIETGSPHARYAVLERVNAGWHVQHLAVSYDWDAAADLALQHRRPDRAYWLRTGRARPRGGYL
jgi:putative phosphoesterase